MKKLSYRYCKQHGVLLDTAAESLVLYHKKSTPTAIFTELMRHYPAGFVVTLLTDDAFSQRLANDFQHEESSTEHVTAELAEELDLAALAAQLPQSVDVLDSANDAPVIRLLNVLLSQGIKRDASDIHIESFVDKLSVRLRIDGVLQEVLQTERVFAPLLVSRIKVMAKLDIAEKRLPQDGRMSLQLAGRAIDVRVSTLPSNHGERVVLRLLDKQQARLDLEQLGMRAQTRRGFQQLIQQTHGIILVTGPTGSGKTTSLYAALNRLNTPGRNILTVEDPIEYDLPGIGQTQVNSKVDMTFAKGLRAILRQDPDVVMIGEIRDIETAKIAVQASLTGHLVLSTLHTNSAVGAITRLRDMGIEPFLLSASLIGVVAQRLVRTLCANCRRPVKTTQGEQDLLGSDVVTIYESVGCDACAQTGYAGRTGLYELIEIDSALRELIHCDQTEQAITQHVGQSVNTIAQHGVALVRGGITSLTEVLRITNIGQVGEQ